MESQQIFELTAKLIEVERQRNITLTDCANKAAQLAVAGQKIGELEEQIKEMTPKSQEV